MVGAVAKALTGKRQAEIASISGFAVPGLANGPDARLMISIIKIFNPGITDADKKSWLIWGVPIFAIAIFLLGLYLGENKWFNLAVAAIGILIFLFGVYKITTMDLNKLVLNAKIGIGVWLTLCGYLGLGVVAAICFAKTLAPNQRVRG
jgi:O-antigen/teichoic acid export membrane protein